MHTWLLVHSCTECVIPDIIVHILNHNYTMQLILNNEISASGPLKVIAT